MKTAETKTAHLATLLDKWMSEAAPPPICVRIRSTRIRLMEEARALKGPDAAREYTQENVAHRVGVTTFTYRSYEKQTEPNYRRRRQIAKAFGLAEEYFEGDTEDAERIKKLFQAEFAGLRAELERLREEVRALGGDSPSDPQHQS